MAENLFEKWYNEEKPLSEKFFFDTLKDIRRCEVGWKNAWKNETLKLRKRIKKMSEQNADLHNKVKHLRELCNKHELEKEAHLIVYGKPHWSIK